MKIYHYLLSTALFLSFGCSTNDGIDAVDPTPIFPDLIHLSVDAQQTTTTDADALQSRAIVSDNAVKWEAEDEIALYALSYAQYPALEAGKLTATSITPDSRRALFEGDIPEPAEKDSYFAAYPSDCQLNSTSATFTISTAQAATTTPAPLMVAKIEDTSKTAIMLNFEAVNTFLRVNLADGLGLTAIRFEGLNDEAVAGSYVYNFADGATSVTGTDKSITISNPGTMVYFALPAITLSKGYKLTFIKGAEQMVKSYGYGVSKTFEAGLIYNVPTVTEFKPISVTLGAVTTSYSLYQEGKIAEANAFGNNTITIGDCSFAGIPNALIAEAGIMNNTSKNITVVSLTAKTFEGTTFTTSTRGSSSIKAYIKDINGNTYETEVTEAIITGLPYTANPPRNSGDYAWSNSGGVVNWNDGNVQLSGAFSAPTITSSDFFIPADINTTVAVSGDKSGAMKTTLTVQVNGTNIISNAPSGNYSLSGNGTFTPSAKNIYCKSSYTVAGPSLRIANLTANYR